LKNNYQLDRDKIEKFSMLVSKKKLIDIFSETSQWDKICAAMDSIRVAIEIINRISWADYRYIGFAFQLIELLTAGQMIKKSVMEINWATLGRNYPLAKSKEIFTNPYALSDDELFREYRALAFAHSVDFRQDNAISEGQTSYFAYLIWDSPNEKIAKAFKYPAGEQISIKFDEVFKYVLKRYEYLDCIYDAIVLKYNIKLDEWDEVMSDCLSEIEETTNLDISKI